MLPIGPSRRRSVSKKSAPSRSQTPSLRYHLSGQSVVTLDGRDFYLGKHGSAELLVRYAVLIPKRLSENHDFLKCVICTGKLADRKFDFQTVYQRTRLINIAHTWLLRCDAACAAGSSAGASADATTAAFFRRPRDLA